MEENVSEIHLVEGQITTVDVRPSDVIVLMFENHLSSDLVKRLEAMMKPVFPDNQVMVIEGGGRLGIIRSADDPAIPAE